MDFAWTNEAVNRLTALAQRGYSSGAIAAILSDEYAAPVSRNSVIGKMHRAGIQLEARRAPPAPKPASPPKIKFRPKPRLVTAPAPMSAPPPPAKAEPVTFAQLERHHCRWPIGDVGHPNFRFCGARRPEGRPYCAEHHAKAWRRP